MHVKNIQIECRTRHVRQFKGKVILNPELETNMGSK
jgi:hypothetical protein